LFNNKLYITLNLGLLGYHQMYYWAES